MRLCGKDETSVCSLEQGDSSKRNCSVEWSGRTPGPRLCVSVAEGEWLAL